MNSSIACIIYKSKKILIARRNPFGDMGGRWEFPGGKIDGDESAEEAAAREMLEEFGVKAFCKEKITSASFEHKNKTWFLTAYFTELEHDGIKIPFTLSEHTEYKWIYPYEIEKMNFVDSDLKIYPEVIKYLEKLK